jgi:hypothetical protein
MISFLYMKNLPAVLVAGRFVYLCFCSTREIELFIFHQINELLKLQERHFSLCR